MVPLALSPILSSHPHDTLPSSAIQQDSINAPRKRGAHNNFPSSFRHFSIKTQKLNDSLEISSISMTMSTPGSIISSVASLAAKVLPETSSSSLSDENHDLEKELNKLMNTLERIKATLHDAEEREIRDRSVKLWLKELKQVAYAAEDVLDEYHYEVLKEEVEARSDSAERSRKRKKLKLPNGLADRIKEIISRFDEIAKDRISLRLHKEDGVRRCHNEIRITPTSHMVVERTVIGREHEKECLIRLLCSDSNNKEVISVVAIVGTGGLGKTTLAQLVYQDPRIRQNSDLLGWVCVSEDFSIERLTREVLESFTGFSYDIKNLSVLQAKLGEKIAGKRIFLVMDDVWNERRSDWEVFRNPFFSAKLAKILVTTRNEPVARIMQTLPSFKLGYLSEEQCWQLFQQYAFGGVNNHNEKWKLEIGKLIMKRCGMLPLAVKSIASLLRHETNEESWRDILESELWEIDSNKEIFSPLQISYSRLPSCLKPCFLYCSMFPKDHVYDVNRLYELWYAQGYIELKGRKTIKELCREYIKQLWERSFIDSLGFGVDCMERFGFKLHDMIHDLARSNSGNECYSIEYGKSPSYPKQICHLYVEDTFQLAKSFPVISFRTLHTLIIVKRKCENSAIISGLSEMQALRAVELDYQCCGFEFLNSIGNLIHLRYVSLQCFNLKKLPDSICTLYNLQILILSHLTQLPNCIGNLVCLQYFSLSRCSFQIFPESICYLRNLRDLYILGCRLVELPDHIENLARLENLVFQRCDMIRILPASLHRLKSLRKLQIVGCSDFRELPREMGNLTNLRTLIVLGTKLSSLPPSLNKLTEIQKLQLEVNITMGGNNLREIGWLNDIIDTKGSLGLTGLENMTSLDLAKHVNLINKHELKHLYLGWDFYIDTYAGSVLVLKFYNRGNDRTLGDEMDLLLLENLQPHPNLEMLTINGYRGSTFPKWIGNTFACPSLENLKISSCYSLLFVQMESVSSWLRELFIWNCKELISVHAIGKLKSLVKFTIISCPKLKSLLLEHEHSHELTGSKNITSLRKLRIGYCPELAPIAVELIPVESCEVVVSRCPRLREWCLQHNFTYYKGEEEDFGY